MSLLATPLSYLLTLLYNLVGNYGIAIIILTVIIKLCLYPVYAKSMKSTMKMSKLQPKMQELQQKYGKDREVYQQKVSELYKEEGASMYGGCLPMVVQMIVIMGLFALLRTPMKYLTDENMLYAIHETFLWIPDLAQPDKWILPLAAAAATFVSFSMSSAQQMNSASMGAAGKSRTGKYDGKNDEVFLPHHDPLVRKNIPGRTCYLLVRQPGHPDLLQLEIQSVEETAGRRRQEEQKEKEITL